MGSMRAAMGLRSTEAAKTLSESREMARSSPSSETGRTSPVLLSLRALPGRGTKRRACLR
eukprot:12493873-Alexandrium_andersonii.AAC.1